MTDCGIYNEAEAMDKETEELVNTLMSISFVSKLLARKCIKQALERQEAGEAESGCGSDPEAMKTRVSCMQDRRAKWRHIEDAVSKAAEEAGLDAEFHLDGRIVLSSGEESWAITPPCFSSPDEYAASLTEAQLGCITDADKLLEREGRLKEEYPFMVEKHPSSPEFAKKLEAFAREAERKIRSNDVQPDKGL